MDTTDPEIEFNSQGVCNHCRQYDKVANQTRVSSLEGEEQLQKIASEIRNSAKGQKYDSILGLSGGVDSSFVAYHAARLGLRPLAVTLDNGWDSRIAKQNVTNVVRKLDLDLHTVRICPEEFNDILMSFLKASVVDIEMPTDQAIVAALFNVARNNNIKYILSGWNQATESIMPNAWVYAKWDVRHIKAIHRKFGQRKIKTFPTYGLFKRQVLPHIRRVSVVRMLDHLAYNQQEAREILQQEFDWRSYGEKHCESILTKFYQRYILPTKFNIDKRKAHLSTLICSAQITREQALDELDKPLYNAEALQVDKKYVLERLSLTEEEFEEIMNLPIRLHSDYLNSQWRYTQLSRIKTPFRMLRSAICDLRK